MSSLRCLVIGSALFLSAGAGGYVQACGCDACGGDPVFVQFDRRSAQNVAKAQAARAARLHELGQKFASRQKEG